MTDATPIACDFRGIPTQGKAQQQYFEFFKLRRFPGFWIAIIATTIVLLGTSGIVKAAEYPTEISPGIIVDFPTPPEIKHNEAGNGYVSKVRSADGRTIVFSAISVPDTVLPFWARWLLGHYPDSLASDCGVAGLERKLRSDMSSRQIHEVGTVARSAATGGFPGAYAEFSQEAVSDGLDKGAGQQADVSVQAYLLIVNGGMFLISVAQPDDDLLDNRLLDDFIATVHFPPADKVGTLEEQDAGILRMIGVLLLVALGLIVLLIIGLVKLIGWRRRKKRMQLA